MAGGIVGVTSASDHRMELLKAFDETKAGVKGLIDSGIHKVPNIFLIPSEELAEEGPRETTRQVQLPVIDLGDILNLDKRRQIVEQVRVASETWGFFQVVNHGIPMSVTDGMMEGVRKFNEQDVEEKKKFYTRDNTRSVRFNSSYDLFTTRTASWKDTLSLSFSDPQHDIYDELPLCCRDSSVEYSKHVESLGNSLLGLLSEALGLETDHLKDMECSMGHRLYCHYYPACPEPELTVGIASHSDAGFLTILQQTENISGLQVFYQGQWVDVHPISGALVVNIGDFLQLVSNGRFKSIEHRATSNRIGPRISVACFFSGPLKNGDKIYGPIKELITEKNLPIYKEVSLSVYAANFLAASLDSYRGLDFYKV